MMVPIFIINPAIRIGRLVLLVVLKGKFIETIKVLKYNLLININIIMV